MKTTDGNTTHLGRWENGGYTYSVVLMYSVRGGEARDPLYGWSAV